MSPILITRQCCPSTNMAAKVVPLHLEDFFLMSFTPLYIYFARRLNGHLGFHKHLATAVKRTLKEDRSGFSNGCT